nr:hypothetical protein [Candidatus Omnitrophota bacterium]
EQGNHQQSQEPLETPVSNSNPKFPEAADIPSNPNPAFEGDRLGVGQGGLLEDALDREGESTELLGSLETVKAAPGFDDTIHPYLEGPSFFDFKESHVSYLPEAVRQTGVELTIQDGALPVEVPTDDAEVSETPKLDQEAPPSPTVRMLEWFITLLDNFEVTLLGPQEIEKQSSSGTAAESVMAAASGPAVTQGRIFPHPWMAAILGATAEVLRLSAEQLRDWLHEAEAFDQGSLRLKISALRKAVNYLLISGEPKSRIPEPSAQGYRLVNAVNVDQELAALHVLANPPRMHPFVRHVLFETQTVPGMLKRYWLDVEKLKALYAKAGTTDEHGNLYLIRYKGQILKNPYRPMPDDMGGRYELVVAE